MSENRHTVGAEVGNIRVPAQYVSALEKIEEQLSEDPQKVIEMVAKLLSQASTAEMAHHENFDGGLFSSNLSNFETRFVPDYEKVGQICETLRLLGHRIVLTSGSFDIIHIGHAQYLEKASQFGDFLIVGVDSDEKIRQKKGEHRPIVEEYERLHMLAHLRSVKLLTLKEPDDEKWKLIKTVKPDTLIATEGTYTENEVIELESHHVGRVVVLPPQSTTSTTARLRKVSIATTTELEQRLTTALDQLEGFTEAQRQIIFAAAGIAIKGASGESTA